jgi:hypothetical protein
VRRNSRCAAERTVRLRAPAARPAALAGGQRTGCRSATRNFVGPASSPHLLDEPIHPAPTRNAFELVVTRILERKPRAVEERHCRFGDEYLTRMGERGDSRRYVHPDAAEVPAWRSTSRA